MTKRMGLTVVLAAGIVAAGVIAGCTDEAATGLEVTGIRFARQAQDQAPAVSGTDPTGAPQDTSLDVEVSGSGFDRGSTVELTLDSVPTEKVRTNSTRYRNSRTLIANITIAADAEMAFYDVEVTTASRKKGIGTEMFEVREKVPGNLSPVSVELIGPAPGYPDTGDPYNVRSAGPQQVWRNYEGDWMNLELRDFPLTLAFSAADSMAMTNPDAPVQGECPVVHDWIFGNDELQGLQERAELRGLFTFGFNGDAALFAFDVPDPFGDGYTYHIRLSGSFNTTFRGDLTVEAGTDGKTTFTIRGSYVSIGQWKHSKRDPYKRTKAAETPWCKLPLADFTLVVSE